MNTIITEMTERGEQSYDVFSRLAEERIIFLSDFIDDKIATDIIATLLYLDFQDNKSKISLYINSDGGDIRSVLMIYDIMNIVKCPIQTVCVGTASEEALLLMAAGTKGERFATKSSKFFLSNIALGGPQHTDMENAKIIMDQIKKDNSQFISAMAKCVGKSVSVVSKDAEKKRFFSSYEAKKYGFIDGVIQGKDNEKKIRKSK